MVVPVHPQARLKQPFTNFPHYNSSRAKLYLWHHLFYIKLDIEQFLLLNCRVFSLFGDCQSPGLYFERPVSFLLRHFSSSEILLSLHDQLCTYFFITLTKLNTICVHSVKEIKQLMYGVQAPDYCTM